MDTLPPLDRMNPEDAYFSWKISLKTDQGEEAIRSVFEFAEWDCELDVALAGGTVGMEEDLPMQPVPFDLSILEEEPQAPAGEQDRAATGEGTPRNAAVAAAQTASNVLQMAQSTARVSPENARNSQSASAAQAAAQQAASAATPTIRVDLDRVDRLINLVGELVINQAMLSQSVIENDTNGTSSINMGLEELQQLTREIQDSVMQRQINAKNFAVLRTNGRGVPVTRKLTCVLHNWGASCEENARDLINLYGDELLQHLELSLLPVLWNGQGEHQTAEVSDFGPFTRRLRECKLPYSGIAFPIRLGAQGNGYVMFAGSYIDASGEQIVELHGRSAQIMAIKQVPVIYDVLKQASGERPAFDAFTDLANALKAAAMGNQPGAAGLRGRG